MPPEDKPPSPERVETDKGLPVKRAEADRSLAESAPCSGRTFSVQRVGPRVKGLAPES